MMVLEVFKSILIADSPHDVLMSLNPVLDRASHHQFLLLCQSIRVAAVFTVEVLQSRWCPVFRDSVVEYQSFDQKTLPVLCSPVCLGAIYGADVQVIVRVLLVLYRFTNRLRLKI
jgi:hypothetical protein